MKNILLILFLLPVRHSFSQGFLKKLKDKVSNAVEGNKSTTVAPPASDGSITFTDPAKYGKPIRDITKAEYDQSMAGGGGYILFFQSAQYENGQVTAQIVFNNELYSYTGGQMQKTGGTPVAGTAYVNNASEKDRRSIDFTTADNTAVLLKSGQHVASGAIRGSINQTFTFNGKQFGSFAQYGLVHNFDSTVVAAGGSSFEGGGVKYSLSTSTGQTINIPAHELVLLSPDGQVAGDFVQAGIIQNDPSISPQLKASGAFIYLTTGKTFTIANYGDVNNNGLWLTNQGNIFSIQASNSKVLKRNDTAVFTFDVPIDLKTLFISNDDKRWAWEGMQGLHFSDGSVFKEAFSASRVYINNKDVILFLMVKDKQVFLCQKEL